MLLEKQPSGQQKTDRDLVGSHYNVTLQGFTLMELIVSMLLLGMLVMLGGYVYSTFLQIQQKYQTSVDQAYDAALVQSMIQKDVEKAVSYSQPTDSELHLLAKHFHVVYQFEQTDSLLVRLNGTQVDTLYFKGKWQALNKRRFRLHDEIHQISYSFTLPKQAQYERN